MTKIRQGKFAGFGEEVWKELIDRCGHGDWGEDDEAMFDIAAKYDMVIRVEYDPALHGKLNGDYEVGDEIWWWGEDKE